MRTEKARRTFLKATVYGAPWLIVICAYLFSLHIEHNMEIIDALVAVHYGAIGGVLFFFLGGLGLWIWKRREYPFALLSWWPAGAMVFCIFNRPM
jgi:hypothetical protein